MHFWNIIFVRTGNEEIDPTDIRGVAMKSHKILEILANVELYEYLINQMGS